MPKQSSDKRKVSGTTRMTQLGRKPVQIWLTEEEKAMLEGAARRAAKPLATWIRQKAFHAAEKSAQSARLQAKREDGPS